MLGSDRKHYRVLDMDFRKGGGRADGAGEETDDEEGLEGVGDGGDGDVEMGGA